MHGVAQRAPLGDGERGGLLQVDVLACLDRRYGDGCMPMIRRADHHGVDILAGEELAVVAVPGYAVVRLAALLAVVTVDQRLGISDAFAVEIADGDNPGRVVFPQPRQIVRARNAPVADGADVDAIR